MKKYSIELREEQRHANEYERHGTVSVSVACEPLGGKRIVTVDKRRTKKDWAYAHA